jgi:O-antigen/teichoic acid export membrane protein
MSLTKVCILLFLEYGVFTWIANRKLNIRILPLRFDSVLFKESFLFNAKSYIAVMLTILLTRGDQFVIKYFLGNAQTGLYSIGNQIIENLCIASGILMTIYLPKFLESQDFNWVMSKSKKLLFYIFCSSVALAGLFYVLAPWIMQMYFKHKPPEAITSFRILLIGFVFWSMYIVFNVVYLTIRMKKSNLVIIAISLALNLTINFLYIPKYGIIAAAWSSTICYALLFFMSYIDLFYLKIKNFNKKIEV